MTGPVVGRIWPLLAVFALAFAAALAVAATPAGENAEDSLYDTRLNLRGEPDPSGDVVLITVDDASLKRYGAGRPPIPREVTARVVRRLKRDGVRAEALDFGYIEETPSDNPDFYAVEDERLYDALGAARPTVLADFGFIEGENGERLMRPFLWFGENALRDIGARVGHTGWGPVGDARFRRVPYSVDGIPTFPVAAVQASGRTVSPDDFEGDGALIDYPKPVPTYSYEDVLEGRIPADALRGKIAILGDVTEENQDRQRIPGDDDAVHGVRINAAAADTIVRDFPLREAPGWLGLLVVGLCAAVAPAAGWRRSAWLTAAVGAGALVLLLVVSQLLFSAGTVIGLVGPIAALVVGTAGTLVVIYIQAVRERRRMRLAVERYLPRAAVERALGVADSTAGERSHGLGRTLHTSDVIGGYRIDGVLGKGGMGVVYEATQLSLGRKVALKVLAEQLSADEDLRARFRREALLQATIDHPHVVRILDAGEDEAGLFIAMQMIKGPDLRRLIYDRDLSTRRMVEVLDPIADALDAAHREGLVHRDIKPQNILIDEDGWSYLSDFGLTGVADQTGLTKTGQFVGTPDYAAPEQIQGEPVTGATDVYALACVYFCALTGHPPFTAPTLPAVLFGHLKDPPPAVTSARPDLPAAINKVIHKGLAKTPSNRYATAGDLARAVREALGVEGAAPPGGRADSRVATGAFDAPRGEPGAGSGGETVVPGGAPGAGSGGETVVPGGAPGAGSGGETIVPGAAPGRGSGGETIVPGAQPAGSDDETVVP